MANFTVKEIIEAAKDQILDDISEGIVPETVKSFEELHEYVDANEYGLSIPTSPYAGVIVVFDDVEEMIEVMGEVQGTLDAWIKNNFANNNTEEN
jgi:hypothetical protein